MKKQIITLIGAATLLHSSYAGLDKYFYYPDHKTYTTPQQNDLAFEDVWFSSADGTRLNGWFIPATGKAKGTVIHFHGNAQNMSAHYSFVSWLPANGFNLFVFDYRGYGKSKGTPTRQGVYEDSVAAMNYIKSRTDIEQDKLIVFGQSIGGANALAVVGNNSFKGIVGVATDSAFASYKGVATDNTGLLKPFAFLLIGNKLSPKKYIGNVAPVPVLLIHGTDDPIASHKHATTLFKKAKEPKELWTIEGGGHTAALGSHAKEYAPKLHARFMEWVSAKQPLSTAAPCKRSSL